MWAHVDAIGETVQNRTGENAHRAARAAGWQRTAADAADQGLMGGVLPSIDSRKRISTRRSSVRKGIHAKGSGAAVLHVVQHFFERVGVPLCRKVCGNAKIESSEGGTNPSAPRGGAAFCRTSLALSGLKVPPSSAHRRSGRWLMSDDRAAG